jgi:hypothetical protein
MPPNTTHVSSASASPVCSGPRGSSLLVALAKPAQQEYSDKARDESAAARRLCRRKARRRQRDNRDFHPVLANPAALLGKSQHEPGEPSQSESDHHPETDCFDDYAGYVCDRPALDLRAHRQPQ